ncbi:hypothetical protein [Corynebacterium uterequi]|nr:hypothetical protein [Corynebacterium uterequi]
MTTVLERSHGLTYRLTPRRSGGYLLFGIVALMLILVVPIIVKAVLPGAPQPRPVVISGAGVEWESAQLRLDGEPLECVTSELSMINFGFDCGAASVDSMVLTGVKDIQKSAKRAMRAGGGGMIDLSDARTVEHDGSVLIVAEDATLAGFVYPVPDVGPDAYSYAQVELHFTDEELEPWLESVWQALDGTDLPALFRSAINEA